MRPARPLRHQSAHAAADSAAHAAADAAAHAAAHAAELERGAGDERNDGDERDCERQHAVVDAVVDRVIDCCSEPRLDAEQCADDAHAVAAVDAAAVADDYGANTATNTGNDRR